ncbi:MAG: hypothetical protein KU29_11515 [Sulfurovum sp. FS06-10]|nr:MAG: hypothetical protein KU29_11515 [Sulfurovum sp. FS06-10]
MQNTIKDDIEFTLEEISETLKIPKETCRQVLLKALKKLKNHKNKHKLEEIYAEITSLERDK